MIDVPTERHFRKINPNSNPNEAAYETRKHDFIDNLGANEMEHRIKYFNGLTSGNDKWNFINETRNANRTATISSLKHCLGDLVTDDLQIANLLNYRFSHLSNYLGKNKSYIPQLDSVNKYKEFTFQPKSPFESIKQIKNLKFNKPIGPSKIPAWASKDAMNVTAEPLAFLINAFLE